MHGPYVRRMIPEPGDPDREVPIAETFHEQTNEELNEKELKQMEADDQAIQTIFMGLPEDIYAAVDSCEIAQEIWYIAQPGMNIGQDRQMQMARGTSGNQYRQYAGQLAGNQNRYNVAQMVRNQNGNGNVVAARAECNGNKNNGNQIRCYNCKGMGHLVRNCIVRLRRRDVVYLHTQLLIAQKEESGIQLQAEEFDLMAAAWDLDEIKEVNEKCILIVNLQQASTSGTQIDMEVN
ncbi:retrovirus-related pol polyprotein from transposon TNT 1-94, partial [Tanacetum coccineum]